MILRRGGLVCVLVGLIDLSYYFCKMFEASLPETTLPQSLKEIKLFLCFRPPPPSMIGRGCTCTECDGNQREGGDRKGGGEERETESCLRRAKSRKVLKLFCLFFGGPLYFLSFSFSLAVCRLCLH